MPRCGLRRHRAMSSSRRSGHSYMSSSLRTLAPRLVGAWTTEATHTFLPGVVIRGRSSVELLGVDGFLLHRTWYDHPEVPDAVSLLRGGAVALLRGTRRHPTLDRKSTRLNSSHANISYAVFCLKKKTDYYLTQ